MEVLAFSRKISPILSMTIPNAFRSSSALQMNSLTGNSDSRLPKSFECSSMGNNSFSRIGFKKHCLFVCGNPFLLAFSVDVSETSRDEKP
jgi:hypothetical protein